VSYGPCEVLERRGSLSLERDLTYDYFLIRRASGEGGGMSSSCGKDLAWARQIWTDLLSLAPCVECGDPPFGSWMKQVADEMVARGLCFWCNAWTNTLAELGSDDAVIDGTHYSIGPEPAPGAYRSALGHGGARFEIEFFGGRTVTTTNLWAEGRVPEHFRGRLPDNARFIQRAQHSAFVGAGSANGEFA